MTPRRTIQSYLPALILSLIAGVLCATSAGWTLGFFLGAIAMATILIPPLTACHDAIFDRCLAAGAVADGLALIALIPVFTGVIGFLQWIQFYLLLLTWAVFLMAMTHLLMTLRIQRWLAAFMTLLLAFAWLLWPIWLSPVLTQQLTNWLTPCHPLLALNGLLNHLGLWSEQAGIAYHLTILNQDIPTRLPQSIWPALAAHLILTAMIFTLAWQFRPRPESTNPINPPASKPR